jgi:UDP-glucose 4,6-dehydratase
MKFILVTGGLGFIGSNFVNYMSQKYSNCKFIILDIYDYCSSTQNIDKNDNVEVVIGDISNNELIQYLFTKFDIDTIIHFAAQTHVDNSFFNSLNFTKTNVLGTHMLLESTRLYHEKTNKIQKFIHVSTDEVYGEVLDNNPRKESSILDPTNPYASSKAAAEFFVKSYYYSYNLPVIITRSNNVYGKNQYPEKVIPKFICQLINGKKLTIQGNGNCIRSFIHVDDVCKAFEMIISKGIIGETYNISCSNEIKIIDLAKLLIKLFNNDDDFSKYIEFIEDRKFNDKRYLISSEKLEELGWICEKTDFSTNLKNLIEWYRSIEINHDFLKWI